MLFSEKLRKLDIPQAELIFIEHFFEKKEADSLQKVLTETIAWEQGAITMFGKKVLEPRLTAWYGEAGKSYTYSGKTQYGLVWTDALTWIKNKIEDECQTLVMCHQPLFNSVLLNYYRNGQDSMGWHSDDERELGRNPVIASLNFGESRRFLLRRKDNKSIKHELLLTHGSLLIMSGEMQHFWQHAVPKEPKKNHPRINLTFRWII